MGRRDTSSAQGLGAGAGGVGKKKGPEEWERGRHVGPRRAGVCGWQQEVGLKVRLGHHLASQVKGSGPHSEGHMWPGEDVGSVADCRTPF